MTSNFIIAELADDDGHMVAGFATKSVHGTNTTSRQSVHAEYPRHTLDTSIELIFTFAPVPWPLWFQRKFVKCKHEVAIE